jgi:hypothetical protein
LILQEIQRLGWEGQQHPPDATNSKAPDLPGGPQGSPQQQQQQMEWELALLQEPQGPLAPQQQQRKRQRLQQQLAPLQQQHPTHAMPSGLPLRTASEPMQTDLLRQQQQQQQQGVNGGADRELLLQRLQSALRRCALRNASVPVQAAALL